MRVHLCELNLYLHFFKFYVEIYNLVALGEFIRLSCCTHDAVVFSLALLLTHSLVGIPYTAKQTDVTWINSYTGNINNKRR